MNGTVHSLLALRGLDIGGNRLQKQVAGGTNGLHGEVPWAGVQTQRLLMCFGSCSVLD